MQNNLCIVIAAWLNASQRCWDGLSWTGLWGRECEAVRAVELLEHWDGNFLWKHETETLCMSDRDCLDCLTVPSAVAVVWSMNLVAQSGAFRLAAAWQFICSHCLYWLITTGERNWQVWNLLKCYQRTQFLVLALVVSVFCSLTEKM